MTASHSAVDRDVKALADNVQRLENRRPAFAELYRQCEQQELALLCRWEDLNTPTEVVSALQRIRREKDAALENLGYQDRLIAEARRQLSAAIAEDKRQNHERDVEHVRELVGLLIPACRKYDSAARRLCEAFDDVRRIKFALAEYKEVHGYSRSLDLDPEYAYQAAIRAASSASFCSVTGIDVLPGTEQTLLSDTCKRFGGFLPLDGSTKKGN